MPGRFAVSALVAAAGLFLCGSATRPERSHVKLWKDGDSMSEKKMLTMQQGMAHVPLRGEKVSADVLAEAAPVMPFSLLRVAGIMAIFSLLCLLASRLDGRETTDGEISWRNWANLIAYVLNVAVTYASQLGVFGPDNGTLSAKYQTLVTPAGFAFAIWGPIFIGEGVFAAAQMLQSFRGSKVVGLVTPGWLTACFFQICWTVVFAQEMMLVALVCMLGILVGLLSIVAAAGGLPMSWAEYATLRWAFSLHLGWIVAATAVNANVLADFSKASPDVLLGMAVTSLGAVCIVATIFSVLKADADPIVCLVAAWAFNGIRIELANPIRLNDPTRHNPHTWERTTLAQLSFAATMVIILALGLAAVAALRALWAAQRRAQKSGADV